MRVVSRRRSRDGTVDLGRARRARRGRSGGARSVVARVLAVAGLGALSYAGWALQIREVRVLGLHRLEPALVVRVAALRGGERILVTRLRDVQSRVESLPGVRKANVHRVLPTTVVIQVTEREPLVRLDGQPQLAADDSGTLFPAPDGVSTPLLQGWRGRAAEGRRLDGGSRALLRAFAAFPRELRTAAQLRAGDDIVLTMGDGLQIRFGRLNAMGAKAAAAQAVLQDARAAGVPLEYIDVRAPRTPVVGSRQTPAPTAKPGTPKPATPKPATPRPATPKPSSGH